MRRFLLFLVAVQALSVPSARAQSLGDVAKQEEARRKAVKSGGKVYTNDSLRAESSPPPAVPSAAAPSDKAPAPVPGPSPATPKTDESKKDEAYWHQRVKTERDALSRSEVFAEALQSRINALTADFSARDDPFQRNQIGRDREKALAELDRVKKDIVDQRKAITDTQEEARKAGIPPGWLR